ncbi:hypothetical protein E2C01_099232 [Portunus trituberculatus]|uniref:Uncharacterized protein n=1 Tax=Portunus trituberculatus TaxID=210409 RepID=A0A5B7K3C2_PORTR|nr:hypothetical protein [Portunus trituberculatus]
MVSHDGDASQTDNHSHALHCHFLSFFYLYPSFIVLSDCHTCLNAATVILPATTTATVAQEK